MFNELRKVVGKFVSNFSVVKVDDKEFVYDSETLYEGLNINTYGESGELIPVDSGTYTIEGVSIDIVDGVIIKIERNNQTETSDTIEEVESIETVEEIASVEPTESIAEPNEALMARLDTLQAEMSEIKELLQNVVTSLRQPLDNEVPQSPTVATKNTNKGTKLEKAERILGK